MEKDTMNKVLYGDCRDTMRGLIAQGVKVQMCVTSPPYFGLRDYGHANQIGLESTPEEFVAALVDVFGLVRELMSDDGVLFLNLGDSYARTGGTDRKTPATAQVGSTRNTLEQMGDRTASAASYGLKAKDLIGIPWRVAFALQADGWYLRQDIIWHKPNPMPESVTDRCTKAHEYIFLLSKRERYYFDAEAIKEEAVGGTPGNTGPTKGGRAHAEGAAEHRTSANLHNIGARETRNKRSVWTVPTKPYAGAHFATFPPALIEPCILAGSRPGDSVLDPFGGSGTTAQVAQSLGRQWIICELNDAYKPLIDARVAQQGLVI